MNFEYIDIILLALMAGFVFLRLKNVLGRRSGHENRTYYGKKTGKENGEIINLDGSLSRKDGRDELDPKARVHFLKGAGIAYETIISAFAKGDEKILKTLLDRGMFEKFSSAIEERNKKKLKYETTFIGIKSIDIKEFKKEDSIYKITVGIASEIITCIRDKENNVVEGDPDTIKTVKDIWKFSKNMWSENPTWYLTETLK